jgi:undecaprenyl-diphosphatase
MDLEFWQAIVLGIVQGATEFLPISSSGHLLIVPWLFGWETPGLAFDAALHLGTLVAVLVYFRRDFLNLARAVPTALRTPRAAFDRADPADDRARDARLLWFLGIATIPAGVAGLLGEDAIEDIFHGANENRAVAAVAIAMMALGLVLLLAERRASHERPLERIRLGDAIAVGFAQALALIPGVSRSGATITAGLFRGLRRADAARFSFLLGTPLILGAGLKGLADLADSGMSGGDLGIALVGVAASALSGFVAIWGLLRYLQRSSTVVFVIYRLVFGASVLLLIVTGVK